MEGMEVEDDEDTYEMVVENGFVGRHSTFDIRFSGRMNLHLHFNEALDPPKRPSFRVLRPRSGYNRRPWLLYLHRTSLRLASHGVLHFFGYSHELVRSAGSCNSGLVLGFSHQKARLVSGLGAKSRIVREPFGNSVFPKIGKVHATPPLNFHMSAKVRDIYIPYEFVLDGILKHENPGRADCEVWAKILSCLFECGLTFEDTTALKGLLSIAKGEKVFVVWIGLWLGLRLEEGPEGGNGGK
ncbi:hypothetical protein Ddye_018057 [Dipteronia dyeriana]|uniref:Uncharacterized protein n=1 Tax=Dipteronia dyeriana TaxID=168575 RepID=A0AAD9X1H1_9ROSI|nr:hypothetical protein Ddye_018057 [Dipteronia dyeriana]